MSVLFSKRRLFVRQVVSAIVIFMVTFSAFSPAVFAQTEGASTPETVVCDDPNAQNNGDDEECEYETDGDNAFNSSGDDEDGTTTDSDNTGTSTDPLGNTATSTASSTAETNPNDGQDGADTATSTATSTDDGTGGTGGADGTAGGEGDPGISLDEADTGEPIPVVTENEIGPDDSRNDNDESTGITGGEKRRRGSNRTIETGPAKAQAEIVNDVNSNLVRSELESGVDANGFNIYEFSATGTNDSTVDTNGAAFARTGDNAILDAAGTSTISSGDAIAGVNIANIINTNVVNSDGFLYLKNQVVNAGESLNLSSFFFPDPAETMNLADDCSLLSCLAQDVEYNFLATNTAEVRNVVEVEAITGFNEAEGDDVFMQTGDARGAANVINVVNTNIVDSNYRLLTYNALGNLDGDLILPTEELFHAFFGRPNAVSRMEAIEGSDAVKMIVVGNDNNADVKNKVSANAETGQNFMFTASSSSKTITGNATSSANELNKINENVYGGDSMYLLIKVHGVWGGDVVGLPDGLVWEWLPEANSILIYNNEDAEIALSPILETPWEFLDGDRYTATTTNNNDVTIENDITIDAITSENKMFGDYGLLQTGDAYASANLMNIANTNVIGTNWTYAVINIFGDFEGDVTFGASGADANDEDTDTDPEELPDDEDDTDTGTTTGPGDTGTTIDLVDDETASTTDQTGNNGEVLGGNNPSANTGSTGGGGGGGGGNKNNTSDTKKVERVVEEVDPNAPPFLVITKTSSVDDTDVVIAGESVDYTITVTNRGGQAYDAVVYDTLRNPIGSVLYEDSWDLGTVKAGEVIELEYTTAYDFKTPSGEYTNTARIVAYRHADSKEKGEKPLKLSDAVHKIEVKGVPLAVGNVSVLAVFPGTNGNASALVSWETSKPALSQVFYGQQLPGSLFNEKALNHGFPQKSFKFSKPKTKHLMIINGLKPGDTYAYRIDAESPEHDFLSREYSFTLPTKVNALALNVGTTFMSMENILGRVAGAATTVPPASKPAVPPPTATPAPTPAVIPEPTPEPVTSAVTEPQNDSLLNKAKNTLFGLFR